MKETMAAAVQWTSTVDQHLVAVYGQPVDSAPSCNKQKQQHGASAELNTKPQSTTCQENTTRHRGLGHAACKYKKEQNRVTAGSHTFSAQSVRTSVSLAMPPLDTPPAGIK
jgi:hypothetical protein